MSHRESILETRQAIRNSERKRVGRGGKGGIGVRNREGEVQKKKLSYRESTLEIRRKRDKKETNRRNGEKEKWRGGIGVRNREGEVQKKKNES